MKKFFIFAASILFSMTLMAQSSGINTQNTVASPDSNVNFRLYQTSNRWTFLKLDTRNGVISHVQYSLDGNRLQYSLNNTPLVDETDAKPGRFFMYPTENIYNFILLDQVNGRVWQVQWSIDEEDRGIWRVW